MTQQFRNLFLSLLGLLIMASYADAQIFPSDFRGISPPGAPFDPNGKFTSIGESGGVPGPTANGCDLYGFRAQVDRDFAVNLGIQEENGRIIPTLTFEGKFPFVIQQQNAFGNNPGALTGCGKALAWYQDGVPQGANFVYAVFGSAIATGGNWVPSDAQLKKNVRSVNNATALLKQLNGVTYEYRTDEYPSLNLNEGTQYGFLAQDVQKIMPEAVRQGVTTEAESADYVVMNYEMIIPVLTEGFKAQQEIIEEQQQTIDAMEDRLARIESLLLEKDNSFKALPSVGLKQNRPNPATGITTIEYELPDDINNASLIIYDARGVAVKRFAIPAGIGAIDYDASELAGGVYIYAIEANGQNLARQKMIISSND